MPVGRRRRRGDASAQKRSRNINSTAQPAKIGLFSQAALGSGVKKGFMNQNSCLRSCPVLIVRLKLMLVPSTEHLTTLASRSTVSQIAARYCQFDITARAFMLGSALGPFSCVLADRAAAGRRRQGPQVSGYDRERSNKPEDKYNNFKL